MSCGDGSGRVSAANRKKKAAKAPLRLLFAAAEALPFSKTGGLADVAAALPPALASLSLDVRLLTIAYRGALEKLRDRRQIARLSVRGQDMTLWEGSVASGGADGLRVWLLDYAPLYAREGGPYTDPRGHEYADNAWRFGCFSQAIAMLALGAVSELAAGWTPQVLHLNDWHTGLAAMHVHRAKASNNKTPTVVFTIHNLAYQGVFSRIEYDALGLPPELWTMEALEFYGGFSFMKAGLLYCDAITTVSPTYAREIQTPAFGERLDGVLRMRSAALHGIANGIDTTVWDPATDPYIVNRYTVETAVEARRANKLALQREVGLRESAEAPLFAFIGRLAEQKGADLLPGLDAQLERNGAQLFVLASGDARLADVLARWAVRAAGRVAVFLGYDEGLSHRVESAADFLLMPSRFEPCGLNQMYSQRYGTVPVVRRTGGLADTVVDSDVDRTHPAATTGILFNDADAGGIAYGVDRALALADQRARFLEVRQAGMQADFGWAVAAGEYLRIYEEKTDSSIVAAR